MININFHIINSFNKKDNHQENQSNISDNFSTVDKNYSKNIIETNSLSAASITGGVSQRFDNIKIENKDAKPSVWRDIFVGAVSATIGAIITYLILGIK